MDDPAERDRAAIIDLIAGVVLIALGAINLIENWASMLLFLGLT